MSLDIILNELSLESPAPDSSTARQRMSEFIQTIKAIKNQIGKKVVLRTHYDFHIALLAPDYPVQRWLNDNAVDREEQRFIKTLAAKVPFSQDILSSEIKGIENNSGTCEFRYQGKIAIGLGIACLLDTIPVSLRSEICWDCSYLDLDIIRLDEEDEKITIIHASCKEHLHEHIEWFKLRLFREVRDGAALWNKKDELFPNLRFCDSVEKQLQALQAGNELLISIEKRLANLQAYSVTWTDGAFNPDKIACKATPESEATLKQYGQERTFTCPDGQDRVFSWHIRLTPKAWRIHFFPIQPETIIGYIGPHLPTAKFK